MEDFIHKLVVKTFSEQAEEYASHEDPKIQKLIKDAFLAGAKEATTYTLNTICSQLKFAK